VAVVPCGAEPRCIRVVAYVASFCGRAGVCGLWRGICCRRVGLVVGGGWGSSDELGFGGFAVGIDRDGDDYVCAEAGFMKRVFLENPS
jgi:hypothetical protein